MTPWVGPLKKDGQPRTVVPGRKLSTKYVSNLYGIFRTAVRDARVAELVPVDPCVLPRGMLRRTAKRGTRAPYEWPEVTALVTSGGVPTKGTMFAALAFFTGMREGEVCGRRWRDWDREVEPLGCLTVATQYDDRPLKTEHGEGEHPRRAPVHPVLASILDGWWRIGFEFTYCRKPTADDFIVPRTRDGKPHTRSSAYKLWRQACTAATVENRSLHSTRHTFITLARRAGARSEVVERITHNASGTIVDSYTHWDWAPLCEAVLCLQNLDQNLDRTQKTPSETGGGAGNRKLKSRQRQLGDVAVLFVQVFDLFALLSVSSFPTIPLPSSRIVHGRGTDVARVRGHARTRPPYVCGRRPAPDRQP